MRPFLIALAVVCLAVCLIPSDSYAGLFFRRDGSRRTPVLTAARAVRSPGLFPRLRSSGGCGFRPLARVGAFVHRIRDARSQRRAASCESPRAASKPVQRFRYECSNGVCRRVPVN